MVLDPLTALSVATSVIQFVDFGVKLISKGREIYKSANGVLADHAEQAAVSSKLAELSRALSSSIVPTHTSKKLSPAEEALREVALETISSAEEFTAAVDELRVTGGHRRWKSFRQALKSVWKKEGLEYRLVTLDRLRQQVIIHLLVCIHETQTEITAKVGNDLNVIKDIILREIGKYDDEGKEQIKALGKEMSKLAREQSRRADDRDTKLEARQRLVDRWLERNETKIDHLLRDIQHKDQEKKRSSFNLKVLKSLYFERLDDRHNMIDDKHWTTLDWIFNPPTDFQSQWIDMSSWLRSINGLYWISGKAGSGKSTLMKWLLHENRTNDLLRIWSGSKDLLIAKHFFWNAGSEIQRSLSGLLRSLLCDLLRQRPDSIIRVTPARWRSYDLELAHFPAWSNEELLSTIEAISQDTAQAARICIFIDGLDEFTGNDDQRIEVLDLLMRLSSHAHIKICVSSRPWELFKQAFDNHPGLRLEDLTRKDIESYINDKLRQDCKFQALQQKTADMCSQLVREIIDKAHGVWLWVVLVVRSLLQGLRNKDTVSDLMLRLSQIPEELEQFFLQILSSIDKFYRPRALQLLKIALHTESAVSLMTLSFIDEQDPRFGIARSEALISQAHMTERIELTTTRVNVRCLGLLESVVATNPHHPFYSKTIEFLHRSARDFLADVDTQRKIEIHSVASFDVAVFFCQAMLAQIGMSERPTVRFIMDFMTYAQTLQTRSPMILMPLLVRLNDLLYYKRSSVWIQFPPHSDDFWRYSTTGRFPLLPIAIQYNLPTYVKTILNSNPSLAREPRVRPLLDFALRRRIYRLDVGQAEQIDSPICSFFDSPDPELVGLILIYGGDPNAKCGESTVWKQYMQFLDVFGQQIHRLPENELQPWIDTTTLLIKHGAVRILDRETMVPQQPSSKTRVRTYERVTLARTSMAAAFGETQATILDSQSWWLSATGQNLATSMTRTVRSLSTRYLGAWIGGSSQADEEDTHDPEPAVEAHEDSDPGAIP